MLLVAFWLAHWSGNLDAWVQISAGAKTFQLHSVIYILKLNQTGLFGYLPSQISGQISPKFDNWLLQNAIDTSSCLIIFF